MPCPKRKNSKQRRNKRRANKGLDVQTFTHCPNSGVAVMPHTVCLESGYYKGVKVMITKADRRGTRAAKLKVQEARKANPAAKAEAAPAQNAE